MRFVIFIKYFFLISSDNSLATLHVKLEPDLDEEPRRGRRRDCLAREAKSSKMKGSIYLQTPRNLPLSEKMLRTFVSVLLLFSKLKASFN
jgi:hypothetical protein